ncbi:MAG TPA: hypothetical protein VHP56_03615 [Solirubrobacterales bacterium]|jgi:hypothetical protein|nr:hypothetical protein [Solirubrobacterales bacterium]
MHPDPNALPFVDEHGVEVAAPPEVVWESLCRVAEGSFASPVAARFARLLGCEETAPSGPRPLAEGSAFPGFTVARAEPGSELALAGRHRYSEYALVFHLDASGAGTRVRAETRARFPGASGRLYRAAVIGTRGHVLVTMRLLAAVKRRAEESSSAGD